MEGRVERDVDGCVVGCVELVTWRVDVESGCGEWTWRVMWSVMWMVGFLVRWIAMWLAMWRVGVCRVT